MSENIPFRPRILVVDDQPINVKLIKRKLENEDMTVFTANGGIDAIKIAQREQPDVILLDVMMPDINGIHVCQTLKNDPGTQAIPIIFISAKSDKQDKLDGLQAGGIDYIVKPIDIDEVVARIRTNIKNRELISDSLQLREKFRQKMATLEHQSGTSQFSLRPDNDGPSISKVAAKPAGKPQFDYVEGKLIKPRKANMVFSDNEFHLVDSNNQIVAYIDISELTNRAPMEELLQREEVVVYGKMSEEEGQPIMMANKII